MSTRSAALLEMRRAAANSDWVFAAKTRSGHVEKSSLRKQHPPACRAAKIPVFPLYTLRHTCLKRWAGHMDPYTLAYLAGHADFSTTKRYVHPQTDTVREAIERAHKGKGGHTFGHTGIKTPKGSPQDPSSGVMNIIEKKEETEALDH